MFIDGTAWKYLRDKYAKEAAKVAGTERSGFGTSDVCKPKWIYFGSLRFLTVILVFKLLPRCWVDREAKGRRLLLNHLLARDVRQMADVVLINPHPASHRLPANDTILAVPDLPNRMTGEGL
ncbi:hypothetical protein HPB47_001589 [Ixodes persulcatus]|uniref:Uncharacterized protein n=1 Tax=Ixodes persulcatus TaxID=34615 RepID=A0AC60PQ19_IXOPE|nr:hypothetical protein HPB47_001589 [Ixodes persulcatus]